MNTQSIKRLEQQLRLFDKVQALLKGKVSYDTITYLFLLHLISGIGQAAAGGMTSSGFEASFNSKRYKDLLKNCFRILDEFYDNEGTKLLGRLRLWFVLCMLNIRKKRAAARVMGLN